MLIQYSDVPAGGQMSIPPAIPQGMLYRVKQIMGVSKQNLKIVPLSGQTTLLPQHPTAKKSSCLYHLIH